MKQWQQHQLNLCTGSFFNNIFQELFNDPRVFNQRCFCSENHQAFQTQHKLQFNSEQVLKKATNEECCDKKRQCYTSACITVFITSKLSPQNRFGLSNLLYISNNFTRLVRFLTDYTKNNAQNMGFGRENGKIACWPTRQTYRYTAKSAIFKKCTRCFSPRPNSGAWTRRPRLSSRCSCNCRRPGWLPAPASAFRTIWSTSTRRWSMRSGAWAWAPSRGSCRRRSWCSAVAGVVRPDRTGNRARRCCAVNAVFILGTLRRQVRESR